MRRQLQRTSEELQEAHRSSVQRPCDAQPPRLRPLPATARARRPPTATPATRAPATRAPRATTTSSMAPTARRPTRRARFSRGSPRVPSRGTTPAMPSIKTAGAVVTRAPTRGRLGTTPILSATPTPAATATTTSRRSAWTTVKEEQPGQTRADAERPWRARAGRRARSGDEEGLRTSAEGQGDALFRGAGGGVPCLVDTETSGRASEAQ